MKQILKRGLSFLLALVMLLGMAPSFTVEANAASMNVTGSLTDTSIGLSATKSHNSGTYSWDASGNSIDGSVTGNKIVNYYARNTVLTITNKKTAEAELSFHYDIPANTGTVTIGGTVYTGSGDYKTTLAANGTLAIKLATKQQRASNTVTISLTNVTMVGKVSGLQTTFQAPSLGSYTVTSTNGDSATISAGGSDRVFTNESTVQYTVTANPGSGNKFFAWKNVTTGAYLSFESTATVGFDTANTIAPVIYPETTPIFKVGSQYYTDLGDANSAAKNGSSKQITLTSSGTVTGTYTIDSGITLLIPRDENYTPMGQAPAATTAYTTPYAYKTLTLGENTQITVNGGTIELEAEHTSCQGAAGARPYGNRPCGPYGAIKMNGKSKIILENKANLFAWGYIYGSGSVVANSGANIYEYMQVTDFRGGSNTLDAEIVFPFSQYYVQNIEVPLTLNYGATESVYMSMTIKSITQGMPVKFIGPSGCMFTPANGTQVIKTYNPATDRMIVDVYGNMNLNSISLDLPDALKGVLFIMGYTDGTIDSSSYILNLNSNITINIYSGTTTINQSVALLPGVEVNVGKNATMSISYTEEDMTAAETGLGYNAFIYDKDEWGNYCFNNSSGQSIIPASYSPTANRKVRTTADLKDVVVNVNGKIDTKGFIYTTSGGASIISSEGTGMITMGNGAGQETVTFQLNGANVELVDIEAVSAQLKNGDGSYTDTTEAEPGTTYVYNKAEEQWEVVTDATITFDDGYVAEDELEPATTTQTVSKDDILAGNKVALDAVSFDRAGYSFLGWDADGDNNVDYTDKAQILVSSDITLTAVWAAQTFDLYIDNEPKGNFATDTDLTKVLEGFAKKDGYTHKGWTFFDANNNPVELKNNKMPAHDLYVVGEWQLNVVTYDLTFLDTNGEVMVESSGKFEAGAQIKAPQIADTETTYFAGWALDGTDTVVTVPNTMPAENRVYKPVMKNKSSLTFMDNMGKVLQTTYYKPGEAITVTAPNVDVPANHTLTWFNVVTQLEEAIPATMPAENLEFMTKLTPNVYTVKFYNGEKVVGDKQANQGGSWKIEAIGEPTETKAPDATYHYTFAGWAESETATTAKYATGDSITVNGDMNLYAVWKSTKHTDSPKDHICDVCNHKFSECEDKTGNDHNCDYCGKVVENHKPGAAATCTTDQTCTECGEVLTNRLNHNYGKTTYTWAENGSSCTAKHVCANDPTHVEEKTASISKSQTKNPTCEDKGETTYTATFSGADWAEKQTKTIADVAKLGHKYGTASYTWSDDYTECTATRVCANDGSHKLTETVEATASVTTAANCQTKKVTTYTTASFKMEDAAVQTKNVTGDKDFSVHTTSETYVAKIEGNLEQHGVYHDCCDTLKENQNHSWNEIIDTKATCTTEGAKHDHCSVCNMDTASETIPVNEDAHAYSDEISGYVNNGDTHTAYYNCIHNEEHTKKQGTPAAHTYTNGKCVCDAVQQVTVTWYVDNQIYGEPVTVNYGADVTNPEVPAKTGYTGTWSHSGKNITADTRIEAVYTVIEYSVTLNANGGKINGKNSWTVEDDYNASIAYGELELTAPVGYEFAGWKLNGEGNTVDLPETIPAGNRTYIAQWELLDVTVNFNEGKTKSLTGKYFGTVNAPVLTKEGYDFLGWAVAENEDVLYAGGAEIALDKDTPKTLYAKWQIRTHNVIYMVNGTQVHSEQVNYGETVTVWNGYTAPEGYDFSGWTNVPATMPDHDVTLTGTTTKKTYTITWMVEGVEFATTTVKHGEIPTAPEGTPTKAEDAQYTYTFAGWGDIAEAYGPATYNAKFNGILRSYDITFVVDGKEEFVSVKYGQTPVYPNGTPTKDADDYNTYTFAGWTPAVETVTGEATYTATWTETARVYKVTLVINGETWLSTEGTYGETVDYSKLADTNVDGYDFAWDKTLPETFTGDMTITGIYTPKTYTITFKNDFETDKDNAFADYTITKKYGEEITDEDKAKLEAALPEIYAWEFLGWYNAEEVEVDGKMVLKRTSGYEIPETMGIGDVTVYAWWDAIVYKLTVKSSIDGEEIAYSDMRYEEHYTDKEEFNSVVGFCYESGCANEDCLYVDGYTFTGYKYEDSSEMTFPIDCWPAEEVTIIAQYVPKDYTITFMSEGSKVGEITAPYGSNIEAEVAKIKAAKEGYKFDCWMNGDTCANLDTMPLNGMTVEASFTINTYKLNFFATEDASTAAASFDVEFNTDLFGAEDNPETPDVDESKPNVLAEKMAQVADPTRTGYTFKGWDITNVPDTMPDEAVNIYAKWQINSYTIKAEGETYTFTYGAPVSVPDAVEEGYTFKGWQKDGQDYTLPATMGAENITITAVWEINTYTITFEMEGKTPITAEFNADITNAWPADPIKTGHSFQGWDKDNDGKADFKSLTNMPAGSLTLIPVWTRNDVVVNWDTNGDGTVDKTVTYKYGDPIEVPAAAKATDDKWTYKHIGWDKDIPKTALVADTYTALFAEDEAVKYTVKFMNGTEEVYKTEVAFNGEVNLEGFTEPELEGHSLTWSVDGEVVTFPYPMTTAEVTFVANWTVNSYTVTIDGKEYGKFNFGETLNIEASPKVGHSFNCWLKDGKPYRVTTMPAEDLELTSDWTVNTYTLTVSYADENGTKVEKTETVTYGDMLSKYAVSVPAHTNSDNMLCEFDSWNTWTVENETMVKYTGETMPAYDVVMEAAYVKTGWMTDDNGTTYLKKDRKVYHNEMATIDDIQYYFDGASYIVKDITEIGGSLYAFNHDTGAFLSDLTGVYTASNADLYYVENGIAVKNYGLHKEVDANGHIHYYIFGCGLVNCKEQGGCQGEYKAQKNNFHMVSKLNGYELPADAYDTGDDGILLHYEDTSLNGICAVEGGLRYLINGVPVHVGLFEQNGSLYYARTRGWLIINNSYWISENKLNGVELNGVPMEAGIYEFDAEGRMIIVEDKNGFYLDNGAWYYYVDNKPSYEGLKYFDGTDGENGTNGGQMGPTEGRPGWYYINTYGMVIAGRDYWITKNNGLMKSQTYYFDEYGTMTNPMDMNKTGIFSEDGSLYYYVAGERNYAGLIQYSGDLHNADGSVTAGVYDGDYLYVNTHGEVKNGCDYWTTKNNGLMIVMTYNFDEYGRMTNPSISEPGEEVKNGIVREGDKLYYYVDGMRTYAGVIEIDGKYYYVRTSGELAANCSYWPTKHNGLVKLQTYVFDADGVMQNPVMP